MKGEIDKMRVSFSKTSRILSKNGGFVLDTLLLKNSEDIYDLCGAFKKRI